MLTELAASQRLAQIAEASYFKPREWELPLYRTLGVEWVQRLVTNRKVPFISTCHISAKMLETNPYFLHSTEFLDLKKFRNYGVTNEKLHMVGVGLGIMGISLFESGALIGALGLAANASLIALQRYNRARIDRIIKWRKDRNENK